MFDWMKTRLARTARHDGRFTRAITRSLRYKLYPNTYAVLGPARSGLKLVLMGRPGPGAGQNSGLLTLASTFG